MININKSMRALLLVWGLGCLPMLYAQEIPVNGAEEKKEDVSSKTHQWMEKKTEEIYSQLNLTDEQKKMLEVNKEAHWGKRKAAFETMRVLKDSLNSELMKPELDMNRINEIQARLKNFHARMTDERLNSILEVRKILTPEQFSKFIALMEKHRGEGRRAKEQE